MTTVPKRKPWVPIPGFGDRLRLTRLEYARRTGAKMGTKEMAQLLGVPASTYGGWEGGSPVRNMEAIAMLVARRTGVDEAWLLGDRPASGPTVEPAPAAPGRGPNAGKTPSKPMAKGTGKSPSARPNQRGLKNLREPIQDPYGD